MNRSILKMLASAAALGLLVAAPAVADGHGDGDHNPKEAKSQAKEETTFCEGDADDLTVTVNGDDVMWPPNHKYQDVILTAVDESGDQVTLMSSATHDEYLADFVPTNESSEEEQRNNEEVGAGNTVNDASPFVATDTSDESAPGVAETTHQLRSERSGRGNGRTYTIDFGASSSDGGQCDGTYTVAVPHDMGNGAENKRDHTEG